MLLFIQMLQSHFAEFLQYSFLKRLNLLNKFTCVGLGYGFKINKAISWKHFKTFI